MVSLTKIHIFSLSLFINQMRWVTPFVSFITVYNIIWYNSFGSKLTAVAYAYQISLIKNMFVVCFKLNLFIYVLISDLKLVERKLFLKHYETLSEFVHDITTMFQNCRVKNPSDSAVYQCAEILESFFVQKLKALKLKWWNFSSDSFIYINNILSDLCDTIKP